MEIFVLVQQKKTAIVTIAAYLMGVVGIFAGVMTCANMMFLPICIAFLGIAYFLFQAGNKEYEYSYFDGEVRFAKITNKSRRKNLKSYSMDEVIQIAPAGDPSVTRYENDHSVKVKDFTSGNKENPYYDMIVKDSDGVILFKLELDEAYLNAVCMKYASKVIRRRS